MKCKNKNEEMSIWIKMIMITVYRKIKVKSIQEN